MKLGVFIERDGVLNKARVDRQHQISPLCMEDFHVNKAALEPLRRLKAAGFVIIATTNQPGLSRGYQSRKALDCMHDFLKRQLPLDDVLVCPHDENDDCTCRRPKPGLILEARFKWRLDLDRSFVISDKWQDSDAAHSAGCTSLMIQSPWLGSAHHDLVLPDLAAAAEKLLQIKANPQILTA
ncbi:MAG: HAD-IIIA family hydrolase [Verrucomicrobia bacterium]|nr:MAG: HAD-IIIA family hydrolase [Verrucomicrobiota bacterium]